VSSAIVAKVGLTFGFSGWKALIPGICTGQLAGLSVEYLKDCINSGEFINSEVRYLTALMGMIVLVLGVASFFGSTTPIAVAT